MLAHETTLMDESHETPHGVAGLDAGMNLIKEIRVCAVGRVLAGDSVNGSCALWQSAPNPRNNLMAGDDRMAVLPGDG